MPDEQRQSLRLWLELARVALPLQREIDGRLRGQFDQSLARFDVMAQLNRNPRGLRVGRLAELLLAATSGNITMLLKRMEKEGLVERVPSREDARSNLIKLTRPGRQLFRNMAAAQEKWTTDLFAEIAPDDRARLIDDLAGLYRRLHATAGTTDHDRQ